MLTVILTSTGYSVKIEAKIVIIFVMPETVDKEDTHNNLISHSTNTHTHKKKGDC